MSAGPNRCRYFAGLIDFQSGGLARLGPTDPRAIATELAPILVDGEPVHLSFKGMRDSVVLTNKRLITINVQGLTGKKRDYSSLPYSKVQAWSIETAGGLISRRRPRTVVLGSRQGSTGL